MTPPVCIWEDHFRPWILSLSGLIHLSLRMPASGTICHSVLPREYFVWSRMPRGYSLIENVRSAAKARIRMSVVWEIWTWSGRWIGMVCGKSNASFFTTLVWLLLILGHCWQRHILSMNWNCTPCCMGSFYVLCSLLLTPISIGICNVLSWLFPLLMWPGAPDQDANKKHFDI